MLIGGIKEGSIVELEIENPRNGAVRLFTTKVEGIEWYRHKHRLCRGIDIFSTSVYHVR